MAKKQQTDDGLRFTPLYYLLSQSLSISLEDTIESIFSTWPLSGELGTFVGESEVKANL